MLAKKYTVITAGTIIFVPMSLLFVLIGLELAIAFLQAYVYVLLLCIYLNEGLHLH
jgi:F0F1-type ATP synthase membrane subunit a